MNSDSGNRTPEIECAHATVSQTPGSPYQYCEDCGAVRAQIVGKIGQFTAWHTCELCRLPNSSNSSNGSSAS